VKIFRFDQGTSIPISDFGSRLLVGPITAEDARVRVQLMYLPEDGVIGRHVSASRQLFGLVVGEATVSGRGGESRILKPGYAAVWEAGEEHAVQSKSGATAVSIEGVFEMWAMGVTSRVITVEDYDPAWPEWFKTIHGYVWPSVADLAVRIDHVGSTSVPGLAAKPIIDMDIVVRGDEEVRPAIEMLSEIGYRWRGDFGIPGRESFDRPKDVELPTHNLYLVVEDNKPHLDHWLLRDLLRDDPLAREEYAALKRRNAAAAENDMDVYIAAKARFVAGLLTRARRERGLPPATYWDPDADGPED